MGQQLRPVRNNNPLDIRAGASWLGLMPEAQMTPEQRAETGFAVFKSPVWGFRAGLVLIRNYWREYGLHQLCTIVPRFAPPIENPTASYVAAMEHWTGFGAIQNLNLEDFATLGLLVKGFATQETGAFQPYWLESQIDTACAMLNKPEAPGV